MQAQYGDALLRLKGILQLEGEPAGGDPRRPWPALSAAGAGEWPEGKAQSRLVFIVKSQDKAGIERLFLDTLKAPEPSLEEQLRAMLGQPDA